MCDNGYLDAMLLVDFVLLTINRLADDIQIVVRHAHVDVASPNISNGNYGIGYSNNNTLLVMINEKEK